MAIRGVDHALGENVCVSIAFGSAVVRGVCGAGSRWGLHSTAGCVGRALVFMWNSGFSVVFCWCRGGGEGVRFGGGTGHWVIIL